jgi:hypothetical protein
MHKIAKKQEKVKRVERETNLGIMANQTKRENFHSFLNKIKMVPSILKSQQSNI